MSLTTNLNRYFKFDESSGNAVDATGGSSLVNTSTTYSGTGALINNHAVFNGSAKLQDSVNIGITGTTARSINVWVKSISSSFGAGDGIVGWGPNSVGNVFAIIVAANQMYFAGYSADIGPATPTLNDNAWHMLSVTYDSTTVKLYVDGAFQISGTPTLNTFDNLLTVGQRWDGSNGSTCNIDELGIWTRALSAAEITQLWNGGIGLSYVAFTPVTLTTAVGSFSMTGVNASFLWVFGTLTAAVGSFIMTGIDAVFRATGWQSPNKNMASPTATTKNMSSPTATNKNNGTWVPANKS